MALEEKHALVLEQPKDQKVFVDVQHSTDWIVAISILVSAIISFIGFFSTIYIVKNSTKSQIQSNKDLMQSQNDQKDKELNFLKQTKKSENILIKGGEFLIALDNFTIELYKVISSGIDDFDKKIENFNQINHQILGSYTLFLLLMEKDSKSYLRMKCLGDLLLKIGWELIIKSISNSEIKNFTLTEEFIDEYFYKNNLLRNENIFSIAELNLLKNYLESKDIYSSWVDVSSYIFEDVHNYLIKIEAA